MIQDFDEFWKLYPNKKSKWYARIAYAKAIKLTTHDQIMEWLRKYNNNLSIKGESKYVKHPATWLNGECREDSYVVKATVVANVEKEVIPKIEITEEQRQANLKRLMEMKANLQSKPTNDRAKTILSEVMDRV